MTKPEKLYMVTVLLGKVAQNTELKFVKFVESKNGLNTGRVLLYSCNPPIHCIA